jgi:hypothetical protein
MEPRQNPYVVGQGLARLTSAFIAQPNIRAILSVYLRPFQVLENTYFDILEKRVLSTATCYPQGPPPLPQTNIVFDEIGALIGLVRNSMSDFEYKALIYLEIAVNRCTGRMSDWSRFAQILSSWSDAIVFLDGDNADFTFQVENLTLPPVVVASQLQRATENGVGGAFVYTTWPNTDDLEWSDWYDGSDGQGASGEGTWGAWPYDTTTGGELAAAFAL